MYDPTYGGVVLTCCGTFLSNERSAETAQMCRLARTFTAPVLNAGTCLTVQCNIGVSGPTR